MAFNLVEKLNEANKYIFVKQYRKAGNLLDALLKENESRSFLPAHLRRVELAVQLHELEMLRDRYLKEMKQNSLPPETARLCLAMIEQHGGLVTPAKSIDTYSEIIRDFDESAAAYYGIGLALESLGNHDRAIFNYHQSLKKDDSWYPSYFGLSQIYYSQKDTPKGDYFFYMFEQHAPYSLYGNFETHRKLSEEFLDKQRFQEAEIAIVSLGEWWADQRGFCPREIKIFETLSVARIAERAGEGRKRRDHFAHAFSLVESSLDDEEAKPDELYFIAQLLEDFNQNDLALKVYKKILRFSSHDPSIIQRIGNHFMSSGELNRAEDLFLEAYRSHPDNPEVRFLLLVSRLKLARVEVDDYIRLKEQVARSIESNADPAENLSNLHTLLNQFSEDSDTHSLIADIYMRAGNINRALWHFQKMYSLDRLSKITSLRYASFMISYGDLEEGKRVLDDVENGKGLGSYASELLWLRASYEIRKRGYDKALAYLKKVLRIEPWNASYLLQDIRCRALLENPDEALKFTDDESLINWSEFDHKTQQAVDDHQFEVAYPRQKLRFIYSGGDTQHLEKLVEIALRYDASHGVYDFIRLLNTNFDNFLIYWGLGVMAKEMGQLEVAVMWFEQALARTATQEEKTHLFYELSDCYVWQNTNLEKAVEYLKVVNESKGNVLDHAYLTMAHAYLKLGQVRTARACLGQLQKGQHSLEASFLRGLLHFRDGSVEKAKELWKPLLTIKATNMKDHWIKKEILNFYFDGKSYMKTG